MKVKYPVPNFIRVDFLFQSMEQKKEEVCKITLNLSPTSLNVFYQSPLLFYLQYIAKVPDDTKVPICYGLSGNIVHDCLEKYAKNLLDKDQAYMHLAKQWDNHNLSFHKGINGNPLNQIDYLKALLNGLKIVDNHEEHICEETISFLLKENESMKIGIKGIIDLQAREKEGDDKVVIDYKTSNQIPQGEDFYRQALFYNLLLHKKKNIIPKKTTFHYLKLGKEREYSFSEEEIIKFEKELHDIADTILSFGNDISKYPIGEIDSVFNSRKKACLKEIERRNQSPI